MTKPISPPVANRGPIPITSISTALVYDPPIQWVQVTSAGSGGLVVKDEAGTPRTYPGLTTGATLYGPFSELTSMTLAGILAGDGKAPVFAPSGFAAAASNSLGTVQMSVAPATAATPIATGTNDPRVCTVEVALPLVLADGSMAESTIWIPGVIGTITGATLSVNASVTQNDTNYLTYTLGIRDGAGGSASTVASASTKVTGGLAFVAFTALSLGALTNVTTAAISQVTFKSVKTASGQACTGPALLRITYTVP